MKLSTNTIQVLKNFASINQNLVIKECNDIKTMSAIKNIVAKAIVEETFSKQVAIYDLNEFLGVYLYLKIQYLHLTIQVLQSQKRMMVTVIR